MSSLKFFVWRTWNRNQFPLVWMHFLSVQGVTVYAGLDADGNPLADAGEFFFFHKIVIFNFSIFRFCPRSRKTTAVGHKWGAFVTCGQTAHMWNCFFCLDAHQNSWIKQKIYATHPQSILLCIPRHDTTKAQSNSTLLVLFPVGPLCEYEETNSTKPDVEYETFREYLADLTQNPEECTEYGEFTWTVPMNAPNTLYYHVSHIQYLNSYKEVPPKPTNHSDTLLKWTHNLESDWNPGVSRLMALPQMCTIPYVRSHGPLLPCHQCSCFKQRSPALADQSLSHASEKNTQSAIWLESRFAFAVLDTQMDRMEVTHRERVRRNVLQLNSSTQRQRHGPGIHHLVVCTHRVDKPKICLMPTCCLWNVIRIDTLRVLHKKGKHSLDQKQILLTLAVPLCSSVEYCQRITHRTFPAILFSWEI